MTQHFQTFQRTVAVAILAVLAVPQVTLAKGHHSGGNNHRVSQANFKPSFKHSSSKSLQTKSLAKSGTNTMNFRRNVVPSTSQPKSLLPIQNVHQAKVVTKQHPLTGKVKTADFVQHNGQQPFTKQPFVNPQNNHCKPYQNCHYKYPWPVFWTSYRTNYGWAPYYGPRCNTTPVIVSQPSQVIVQDAAPAVAAVQQPAPSAVQTGSVDLLVEDVQVVEPATLLVGPAYRVKFRNQGMDAIGNFRVGIVASLAGRVDENSPNAIVDVAGLAGGEAGEVTLRLPLTAMKLASTSGQTTAFTHLLVAADIDGSVSELDKTNNVAVVERADLEAAR